MSREDKVSFDWGATEPPPHHESEPEEGADPGVRCSLRTAEDPDASTVYWAQFAPSSRPSGGWDEDREEDRARQIAQELEADSSEVESAAVEFVRWGLGAWREITSVAIVTVASGAAGAAGGDLWWRVKRAFSDGESVSPLPALDRGYADHLARWFIATEYDLGHWGDRDLNDVFTVVSEQFEAPNSWTFEYESIVDWRFSIRLEQVEDGHATVASIRRYRVPNGGELG